MKTLRTTFFFRFADNLLGTICSLTRTYSPFDPYFDTQLEKSYDIYQLSSDLLMWEYQLARSPENYFGNFLDIYKGSTIDNDAAISREKLKYDLIETLSFLSGKLQEAAFERKVVIIQGI